MQVEYSMLIVFVLNDLILSTILLLPGHLDVLLQEEQVLLVILVRLPRVEQGGGYEVVWLLFELRGDWQLLVC